MTTTRRHSVTLTHDMAALDAVKAESQDTFEGFMAANLVASAKQISPTLAAELQANANTEAVSFASIIRIGFRLAELSKAEVREVAEEIGLVVVASWSKARTIKAITDRIRSVKQSSMRVAIIDRPAVA